MENPKICDCPHTDWCHEVRQWLQKEFREKDSSRKVENCDFYRMIEEKEKLG